MPRPGASFGPVLSLVSWCLTHDFKFSRVDSMLPMMLLTFPSSMESEAVSVGLWVYPNELLSLILVLPNLWTCSIYCLAKNSDSLFGESPDIDVLKVFPRIFPIYPFRLFSVVSHRPKFIFFVFRDYPVLFEAPPLTCRLLLMSRVSPRDFLKLSLAESLPKSNYTPSKLRFEFTRPSDTRGIDFRSWVFSCLQGGNFWHACNPVVM